MRVWLTCFVVLFGGVEFLQWFKQISLPLPMFVLGGAFLAIASNYDKLPLLPFRVGVGASKLPVNESSPMASDQTVTPISTVRPADHPISFEIRKPFRPVD
jgi:hypothetical protein